MAERRRFCLPRPDKAGRKARPPSYVDDLGPRCDRHDGYVALRSSSRAVMSRVGPTTPSAEQAVCSLGGGYKPTMLTILLIV